MKRLVIALSCVLTLLLYVPCAEAQEVGIDAVQAWPDHELLGSPRGVALTLGISLHDRLGMRAAVESYGDDLRRFGSLCVHVLPLESSVHCPGEVLSHQVRMRALTLSLPVTVLSGRRISVGLVPGVRTVWLSNSQEGLATGQLMEADETMYGYQLGAEAVAPILGGPVRLRLGAHLGALRPYRREAQTGGQASFDGGIGIARVQLGLVFRR